MDLAWLTLLALLAVVAASCTTRVNPGIVAIVLAGLIAALAAPLYDSPLDLKAVWAGFPAELFLTLLGVSLLFGQAEANGTLARVAEAAQRLCGQQRGLLPIVFFLLAVALGSFGPGNIAAAGIVAPLAMAAGRRAGISPLVMAVMVGHGAIATSVSPFTAAGVVANQKLAAIGLEGNEWRIYAWNASANAAVAAAGYVLLRGWRPLGGCGTSGGCGSRSEPQAGGAVQPWSAAPSTATPADPTFSLRHGITLAVIAALVLSVVLGKAPIGLAAFTGAALLAILRLADERQTFQRIPWSVLVMVCGVSVLTSLLEKTGGNTLFASLIGRISTPGTLTAVLAFVTGIVSIYSSTTGVVLPAFLPLVKDVAGASSGSDPLGLALAVLVGGNLVDMSPLSTIGALCLAAAPADADRRVLFNQLLAWGFAMAAIGAGVSWICF